MTMPQLQHVAALYYCHSIIMIVYNGTGVPMVPYRKSHENLTNNSQSAQKGIRALRQGKYMASVEPFSCKLWVS